MRAAEYLKEQMQKASASAGFTWPEKVVIEPPKDKKFGDLACNAAMIMAREAKCPPREIAEKLAAKLKEQSQLILSAQVAGAGFINVQFAPEFWHKTLHDILQQKNKFGQPDSFSASAKKKVQIEFVSANPTGPLHIGHARGAAVGDSLARLLRFCGYSVACEYYINDAGRQMLTLGNSVWLRVLELAGQQPELPEEFYKGDYIIDLAREMLAENANLPKLPPEQARALCFEYAHKQILAGIKADLERFKVNIDSWFSERELAQTGAVQTALDRLQADGKLFEEEGALWFCSTEYGDDKDRVLRKSNGDLTYFASDIAYHQNKLARGFDLLVDIWGADHHGYIPRMKAAIQALGYSEEQLAVIIIQLVNWLSNGQQMAMSTRAGQFETLADVLDEVGVDAARFMFLYRKADSPLDFDLDLVKSQNMDNPVYYVQYAHARICTLFAKAQERGVEVVKVDNEAACFSPNCAEGLFSHLIAEDDLEIIRLLDAFPGMLASSAEALAPHHLSFYLMELAGVLHSYYAAIPILNEQDESLKNDRLGLLAAVGQVLSNGLALLGVNAPSSM